jgi:hypothetical protein
MALLGQLKFTTQLPHISSSLLKLAEILCFQLERQVDKIDNSGVVRAYRILNSGSLLSLLILSQLTRHQNS